MMRKPLIAALLFLAAVVGLVAVLFLLYTPVTTQIVWEENGIFFSAADSPVPCPVKLGGTLKSYRFDTRPAYFSSNPYSRREGILLDGTQISNSLHFNLPSDNTPIRFCRSGITLFTDQNFSFAVVILPSRDDLPQIAIAPAATEAQAMEVLSALLSDPRMQNAWTSEAAILRALLPHS